MSYTRHMKGYNDPRTFYQIDRLYRWKNNLPFAPSTVEISPINVCNQKCRYCYVHSRNDQISKDQGLPDELFVDIMNQCGEMGVGGIILQGTGEPLLHRGIGKAIKAGAERKLPIWLTTNGVLLERDLAEEIVPHLFVIKFSNVDSDPSRYCYQHDCPASHFDRLKENIQHAVAIREKGNLNCSLMASLYVTDDNYQELYQVVSDLKSWGLDYVIIGDILWTSQGFEGEKELASQKLLAEKTEELQSELQKVEQLNDDDFRVSSRLSAIFKTTMGFNAEEWIPGYCEGIKFYPIICSDGEVYPCWRFWGDKEFSYGNLHQTSLKDVLTGDRAKELIAYVNSTPPMKDECTVCTHVRLNERLYGIKNATEWMNFQ